MMNAKLGICEWSIPARGSFSVRLAKECGFDGLQISLGAYLDGFPMAQKRIQDCYMDESSKYGIELLSISINELDFCSIHSPKDTEKGQLIYDMLKKTVLAAGRMGIQQIMLPTYLESNIKNEEEMMRADEALQFACDLGMDQNVEISLESDLTTKTGQAGWLWRTFMTDCP